METHSLKFKIRLGLFLAGGIVIFIVAIFFIGKQKNMFNPVYTLSTTFYNVSGLQVGNNVRFSGINVGTVDNIEIINDSTVRVEMVIRKEVQKFIKADSKAAVGSAGLIGDRILIISQGTTVSPMAKENQHLTSTEPVETDAIMASLQVTAVNAAVVSDQMADMMIKINDSNGTIWRLIEDSTIAENINQTIVNLKKSSKGLDENMNAAKDNFFLKGYFQKKEKAKQKLIDDAAEKKADELEKKNKK